MPGSAITAIVSAAALAVFPLALGEHYFLLMMTQVLIFCIATISLQFLIYHAGILSLSHAAFVGLGAYGAAILTYRFGFDFVLALLAGMILSCLAGLVMSLIIRLREIYFAMASFAFGIIVFQVLTQWKSVTGGHDGLIMIPVADLFGYELDTTTKYFYFALAIFLGVILFFNWLRLSSLGKILALIRESEPAARSIGVDTVFAKVLAIVIACAAAGLAGGMLAHLYGTVSPNSFGWQQSILLLTMVVVGGAHGILGVLLATFVLIYLPNQLRDFAEYSALVNGVLLTLVVVLLPEGLGGVLKTVRGLFRSRQTVASMSSKELV